jgi:hypothetical protein
MRRWNSDSDNHLVMPQLPFNISSLASIVDEALTSLPTAATTATMDRKRLVGASAIGDTSTRHDRLARDGYSSRKEERMQRQRALRPYVYSGQQMIEAYLGEDI